MFLNNVADNTSNWLSLNIDLSSFVVGIVGIYFAYLTYKQGKYDSYMKERYEKVILFSFSKLESFLYNKINDDIVIIVKLVSNEILKNRKYFGGKLLDLAQKCNYELNQSQFNDFCLLISKDYDKCCKHLGIPLRSYRYKYVNKQFAPFYMEIFNFVNTLWKDVRILISLGLLLALFQFIFNNLLNK